MMELTDDFLTGTWNGFFTRNTRSKEEQEDEQQSTEEQKAPQQINFILNLQSSSGEISGTFTDEETKEFMTEPATFTGFIDETFISFVLQYPYFYSVNEADELIFDEYSAHPPIHYSGEFIEEEQLFRGVWEIEYYVHDVMDDSQLYVVTGNWEMTKQ